MGENFQRADSAWGTPSWLSRWWDIGQDLVGDFADRWKWVTALAPLPAYLVMTWKPGTGYAGKILVSGPALARDILGLSPRLSHIKTSNLLGHISRNTMKVGPWFLLGAAIESAKQWMNDIEEYKGDLIRTINAITIDTEVIVATMGLTALAAVKIGAVIVAGVGIGGTVGPLLVVGGLALGIGLLADKFLLEPFFESDFRHDAIEWLTLREQGLVTFVYDTKDQVVETGHDFVKFLDAQIEKIVGNTLTPLPVAGPMSVSQSIMTRLESFKPIQAPLPAITPQPIQHLSQLNPEGSEILDYTRYENPAEFEAGIVTVRDHIKKYGCLMTGYTMLLRGQGFDAEVTDLYLTKVGKSGVIDTTNRSVTLFDLYTGPELANDYLEKQGVNTRIERGYLAGSNDIERLGNLEERVREVGSLVVHVQGAAADGHWIVVTRTDDDSLVVLDPLKSTSSTVSEYQLFGQGEVHYLSDEPAIM